MEGSYSSANYEEDDSDQLDYDQDVPREDTTKERLLRQSTLARLKKDKYGNDLDKENFMKRLRYYVPILSWLPRYKKENLMSDLLAGMAVACLLIPQSLSYASLANLDAVYGLYASFIPLMIYTILGTSRHAGVGPEAVASIMVGAAISDAEDYEERLQQAAVLTFLVGIFTFALGLFRLGYLDCLLSRATNRGFIIGVAFVVIVEQLPRAMGLQGEDDDHGSSTIQKIIFIFEHIETTRLYPCLFSSIGVAFLLGFKFVRDHYFSENKYVRLFPAILVLVIISELLAWGLGLDDTQLPMLGLVQDGFVKPFVPRLSSERVTKLLLPAVVISIVGFVESIVVAKEKANKHGYAISDNRELVAFGVANLFNSFFGGYPAFSSLSRTSVADASGARSQLYGFVVGIFALFGILFMLPAFQWLPLSIQAAIVLYAAINLIELHDLQFLWRIRAYTDLGMVAVTFFVTILVSVEVGIFVSILVSIGFVMKETTKPTFSVLGCIPGTSKFVALGRHGAVAVEGITVLQIHDSLYFANSGLLKDRLRRVELFGSLSSHPGDDAIVRQLKAVVFDIERMLDIDASALQSMTEIAAQYESRHIRVAFVRTSDRVRTRFEKAGVLDVVAPSQFFDTCREAVDYFNRTEAEEASASGH